MRVRGFEPRSFTAPFLLLLLTERPGHGYDLVERLRPFGMTDGDSCTVYRVLRALEQRGCLCSDWRASKAGPARRIYRLTDKGHAELTEWLGALEETRRTLDYCLNRLAPLMEGRRPPVGAAGNGRPAVGAAGNGRPAGEHRRSTDGLNA